MSAHAEYSCAEEGCGHVICLTPRLDERLKRTHETFYCPARHSNYFPGKTDEEKKIERLVRQIERWRRSFDREYTAHRAARRVGRSCLLCGITLRSRGSLERHLRSPIADGGHGAQDVALEVAEAHVERGAWPKVSA